METRIKRSLFTMDCFVWCHLHNTIFHAGLWEPSGHQEQIPSVCFFILCVNTNLRWFFIQKRRENLLSLRIDWLTTTKFDSKTPTCHHYDKNTKSIIFLNTINVLFYTFILFSYCLNFFISGFLEKFLIQGLPLYNA